MYKVMLIDDDMPMLKYLRTMIHWQNLDLEISASTHSAIKSLQLFDEIRPDIVVVDIGIPQINGLDLVEKFKKIKPTVRVIFLTCHEDFSYAKRALELNADDYLIKDELTPALFEESLISSLQIFKSLPNTLEYQSFHEMVKGNKEVLKRNFLEQILGGKGVNHNIGKMVGINWRYSDFIVGIGKLNLASLLKRFDFEDVSLIMNGVLNVAEELAKDVQGMTPLIDQEHNLYIMLNFRQTISRRAFDEYHHFIEKLQNVVNKYWEIDIIFSYSKNIVQTSKVGNELSKLDQARLQCFYTKSTIESIDVTEQNQWSLNSDQLLLAYEKIIMDEFETEKTNNINHLIKRLEEFAFEENINPTQFIEYAVRWIRSMEIKTVDTILKDDFIQYFRQSAKLHEVTVFLKIKVIQLIKNYKKIVIEKKDPRLQKVDQYIIEHQYENISSIDMANHLVFNPSYFSRYFKKISGQNFTDYVHSFKMKAAKEMLEKGEKSIEKIASHLGYSDRTYFSKIFKKYIGYAPSEYRTRKEEVAQ